VGPALRSCAALALLAACATPAQRVDARAAGLGYTREIVAGAPYRHLLYFKPGSGAALHVYIEHDGSPWLGENSVATDPTPREPLMLELMAADPAPGVYLGRPCHFGVERSPPCSPLAWTHERFSEQTVASMAAALSDALARRPYDRLAFFGYSGGGTLAWLLAEHFAQTTAVVTLAGNLDIDAWARLHDYSALVGSLNPADRAPLPDSVTQIHYVGTRDRNVPPGITHGFAQRHPGVRIVELADFDHRCCWRDWWPAALRELSVRGVVP
jgi:pimeloyl-ACP methyl ester carboxylesterase